MTTLDGAATRVTRDGNASLRVADALREAISHGVYPPGTRLRQEEIAERFGASRVPVREALKVLEADGIVTLVANTGAWVSRLTLAECEEVYQTRERLEPLLLRLSAPHLDNSTIDELERLAERMAETPSFCISAATFSSGSRFFHSSSSSFVR